MTKLVESICVADLNILYANTLGIKDALKECQLEYRECLSCGLGFFWPMASGDEALYEQLQAFDWYYMANKDEFKTALRFLSPVGTILEVGAGEGLFASQVGVDRYTGLEFNDCAIERAKNAGINLIKESVELHAKTGEQYDSVVSFQVLEHVSSPFSFIKSCLSCLKPGGILILAVPSQDGFIGGAINHILDMPPHHVSRWSEKTLHNLAGIFDLEIVFLEHEHIASYHQLWARKIHIETVLRKILRMNFRILDCRVSAQLVSKAATLLARFLRQPKDGLKGHTLVAGYRKK